MDKFDLKKYLAENKLNEESNSNETAVDFFAKKLNFLFGTDNYDYLQGDTYKKAKELERQQIKNAFEFAQNDLGMEADEYINYMNLK